MRERYQEPSLKDQIKNPAWWIPIILVMVFVVSVTSYKMVRGRASSSMEFEGNAYDLCDTKGSLLAGTAAFQVNPAALALPRPKSAPRGVIAHLIMNIFSNPTAGTVVVDTIDGQRINWPIQEDALAFMRINDYIVKPKGEKAMVFRMGRQLTQVPYFDNEKHELAAVSQQFRGKAPAEVPEEIASNTAAPVASVEEAEALIQQASALWKSGNKAESIAACEEALPIFTHHLGDDHERVAKVRQMIATAKGQAAPAN